ncbi:histone deacetylase family protein [Solimonas sp. C16B3]|uniref:Histone deacetylase family protein n=1 Tax=Solimonas marina TaxID=2714601 RepID=A0A969WDP6_9GAMM|nr:histone deacetylase family protein [Solimonas marina]
MPNVWISHASSRRHRMEDGHPECPERLAVVEDRLVSSGLELFLERREAPAAPLEALLRVHEADHVESVLRTHPEQGLVHIDPDTSMNAYTADAALHAAGAGVLGVELAMNKHAGFVFCGVRPPGHHAERHRAMGFCFFNNVAVAAAEALARGLRRVAILDFDVHYGNGTADIFRDDPRVLLCSTYQYPLYPDWHGEPDAPGRVDVPLSPGDGSDCYRTAVQQRWLPALEKFAPEMLLVSAGFDAHVRDPLSDLRLVEDDFYWTGTQIRDFAAKRCEGRVVATLEGGYDPYALAVCVESFVRPFIGA